MLNGSQRDRTLINLLRGLVRLKRSGWIGETMEKKYQLMMMIEEVRLTSSWIKENCEVGVTCGECGRHLTGREFEDHKEACRLLQN